MAISEESYPLFCRSQGGLTRWISPGNPFQASAIPGGIDLFGPSIGSKMAMSFTPESWKTQALQRKIEASEINGVGPIYRKIKLGKILWVGKEHKLSFRPGNIDSFINTFRDTRFIFMDENNCEIYQQLGFTLEKKEVRWRTEGGETLYLHIFDPNGYTLDEDQFIYIDFDFMYDSEHYLIGEESGNLCQKSPKIKKVT